MEIDRCPGRYLHSDVIDVFNSFALAGRVVGYDDQHRFNPVYLEALHLISYELAEVDAYNTNKAIEKERRKHASQQARR